MKKSVLSSILATAFALAATCSYASALDANALPNVVGSVNVTNEINNATHTLTSTVNGGTGAVGQNDMTGGLGSNGTWNINASAHSQTFLGRFVDGNLTHLNGKINTGCASGLNCGYGNTLKVILTNPYGITFGPGSIVNANSFTVSGYDVVGAQNLKNMTAAQKEAYGKTLNSKYGPNVDIRFENTRGANGGIVTLDNSTWNIDKTAAIIAKDINVYKGSKISTNLNYNYGNPATQNFSNVKLVTSDGVTFKYIANGYVNNNGVTVDDANPNVTHTINIGDKNSANAVDASITSGHVYIANKGTTDASKVNVNKAAIKGYKLINNAYGDILLVGNDVDINDSTLETFNTYELNNTAVNTHAKQGGNITVDANKNINIKNSTLTAAYSTTAKDGGDIKLSTANAGNINLTGTTLNAKGSVNVNAYNGKVVADDVIFSARNKEASVLEDVNIYGSKGVSLNDTYVDASNNATIKSGANIAITDSGKINADNKLSIIGKNSLIEDSTLTYKELALHDGTNTNNVTIKGATTLKDTDSATLVVDVKGNLVVDNNSLKANDAGAAYSKAVNQNAISLKSTGDITIKNNSDVTATNNISINAGKNANINNSKLTAKNNTIAAAANINLDKAKVKATTKNTLTATTDVNSDCSEVTGTNNEVVAKNGAITVKNSAITATADNKLTAKTDVKTANVRIKGVNNTLTAQSGKAEIVNTDLTATKTNTVTANNGNVTFKFDKDLQKACTGNGCIEVVAQNKVDGTDNVITADKGNIVIDGVTITAKNDNTITAPKGSISLKNTKLKADNDNKVAAAVNVDTDCVEMDAKNNNEVTAQTGKVTMKNTVATAKKDNKVSANLNITTENVKLNAVNNTVQSATGNINHTNTQYIATGKNTVNAKTGDITFKYDTSKKGTCTGAGCNGPIDNNVTGKENDITADKGSITLEDIVVKATDGDNDIVAADDVTTKCAELEAENNNVIAKNGKISMTNTEARARKNNEVVANLDVVTKNVRLKANNNNKVQSKTANIDQTNTEYIAKRNDITAQKGKVTFKYSSDKGNCKGPGCTDADPGIKPIDPEHPEDTVTVITADEVSTGARVIYDNLYDQKGRIVGEGQLDTNRTKVKINSTGNVNLVLKNTDNKKAGLEVNAPKIEIKTRDGKLSISRLKADELYLSKDEKFIAGTTTLTAQEKMIDSFAPTNPESLSTPEGAAANVPGRAYIEVHKGFNFDYEPSTVAVDGMYQGSFNELKDAQGNVIGYGKHYITLDNNSTEGQFVLSYAKPFACEPEPPVITDDSTPGYVADQTAWTRIPLQSDMIGQVGNIANGITDPSSGMIAAAAAIDVENIDDTEY